MSLIDEHYVGRRPHLWEEWTSVEFTITEPPKPVALPQPAPQPAPMPQTPIFGSLDREFVDPSEHSKLVKLLSEGVVEVTFETAEGNVRTLLCTTYANAIPEGMRPKVKAQAPTLQEIAFSPDPSSISLKTTDKNLFKVFAIDLQEWRSFRFERVKSFTKYAI